MRCLSIIKFPVLLISGSLLSNAGDVSPQERAFRSIIESSAAPFPPNILEQTESDPPALKIPDHSGRVHDSLKTLRLAQSYYKRQLWESARKWYLESLKSNPDNQIAAEGYAMSSFHEGRLHTAKEYGEKLTLTIPLVEASVSRVAREQLALMVKNGELSKAENFLEKFPGNWEPLRSGREELSQLQARKSGWKLAQKTPFQSALEAADAAYQDGQYTTALWNLDEASRKGSLPRASQLLKGRSLIHLTRFDEAARLFEKLYQTQTDIESARGIVVALHKKGDRDRLARLADEWGGILSLETETYHHEIEPDTNLSDAI